MAVIKCVVVVLCLAGLALFIRFKIKQVLARRKRIVDYLNHKAETKFKRRSL